MRRVWDRLRDSVRSIGVARLLWIAPCWLVARRFRVLSLDLTFPPSSPTPLWPWRASILHEDEIRQVLALDPRLSEKEIRRRWARGQECHLGWSGDVLVHHRWEAIGPVELPYLALTLQPADGECYVFDIFTQPGVRGRGVYTAVALWSLERARQSGLRRSLALVAWWNRPSLAACNKIGYATVGTITRWRLGPRPLYSTAGRVRVEKGEQAEDAGDRKRLMRIIDAPSA